MSRTKNLSVFLFLAAADALPLAALAQNPLNQPGDSASIAAAFGFGSNTDIRESAINVVAYLLTFLGLVAILIVLYAGYMWMTAGGNEDRVKTARSTLQAGIIGLLIILAAYALTQFVIGQITAQINA